MPLTATEEDAVWSDVCHGDGPTHELALLALADSFEELGEDEKAACLRWCSARGHRSYSTWWNIDRINKVDDTDGTDIPGPLFFALRIDPEMQWGEPDRSREYGDGKEAWLALLAAWPLAIADGWVPPPPLDFRATHG